MLINESKNINDGQKFGVGSNINRTMLIYDNNHSSRPLTSYNRSGAPNSAKQSALNH